MTSLPVFRGYVVSRGNSYARAILSDGAPEWLARTRPENTIARIDHFGRLKKEYPALVILIYEQDERFPVLV